MPEDQFIVGVEVDPSGITQGLIGGERAVTSFTDKLDRAERGLRKAQGAMDLYGESARRQNTVASQQLRVLQEEARVLAASVQQIRNRTASAAGLLRTEEVRARVAAAGVTAESRLGRAIAQQTRLRQQLQAQLRASIQAQEQENRVAGNIAGLRARGQAIQDEIRAAREGVEALREYREMAEARQTAAATGAVPGSAQAEEAEREARALIRLRGELAAVTAARERDDAAAARAGEAIAELAAENRQLAASNAARRQGAAAIRAYNEQQQVSNTLQRAGVTAGTAQAERLERLARENARLRRETDELTAAQRRQTSGVGSLRNAFNALQAALLALGLGQLIRSGIELVTQWERAERTFTVVTGSLGSARQQMAFVRAEADRLGLVFTSAAVQFSQFVAASKSSLSLSQAREVFSSVSEALANLGASEQQAERALYALQQMANKGRVSLEELSQQLGDSLPGAMELAAKAAGKPLPVFLKMVENGEILARDLLPKLAVEIRAAFGTGGAAIDNTQARLNRFKNGLDDLRRSFGQGFLSGLLAGFAALQKEMSSAELQQAARNLGETLGTALRRAAEAAAFLSKNLEILKAVLISILALKAAAWFISLATAIATATGRTIAFKTVMSNLALAGGLAAAGIALSALIVVMDRYIAKSQLAHETEMKRVARAQELFSYYDQLKANKKGLTEEEWAYANSVLKTMVAERAALTVSLARTRAQLQAAQTRNPFKYLRDAGPGRNALSEQAKEQEQELKTIQNQILILDSEWQRLGDLPVIMLPVDTGDLDKAGKKIADLLDGFRRAAEQAERVRDANRDGAAQALAVAEAIERENAAYDALKSIEGLSADAKQRLTSIIEALVGRTQDATRATEELIATRERDLAFSTSARQSEAALADARANDATASRELAVALEAEGIAREMEREGDVDLIKILSRVVAVRHEYLATIDAEARSVQRANEARQEESTLRAQLEDALTLSVSATRANAVAVEVERLRIEDRLAASDPLVQALRREVEERHAVRNALEEQLAVAKLVAEQEAERAHIQAEFFDFQQGLENARRFGDELGDIATRYGILGSAVDELILRERILAAIRDASIDTATEGGRLRAQQIEAEIRQTYEAEKAVRQYAAAVEVQRYVLEPLKEGWRQVGDTVRSAVVDAVIEGKLSIEDLGKTLLRVMLDAITKVLVRWIQAERLKQAEAARTAAAQAAAANAGGVGGGGGGGGWLGQIGSWFGGGGGAAGGTASSSGGVITNFNATTGGYGSGAAGAGGASGYMATLGWAAVFVGAILALVNQAKTSGRAEVDTSLTFGGGEGIAYDPENSRYNRQGGLARFRAQAKAMEEMVKQVTDFITSLGGAIDRSVTEISGLTVGREGQGRKTNWFVRYANGQIEYFGRSMEEAFEFAAIQAIKQTPTVGLDPIVAKAIEESTQKRLEAFQRDVARAQEFALRGLDPIQIDMRRNFQQLNLDIADAIRILGTGPELDAAINNILTGFINGLQSVRNSITGRQLTPEEEYQQQLARAELFNAEKALMRSRLEAEKLVLVGKRDALRAEYELWKAENAMRIEQIRVRVSILNAEAEIFAEWTRTAGGVLAASLVALDAQIAGLDRVLEALDRIADIDPSEVARPGRGSRGGGGDRRQEREDLARELERAGLSDLRRTILGTRDAYDDTAKRIRELGFRGEEAARLLALANAEMERQITLIRQQQIQASDDFIRAGTAGGGDLINGLVNLDRTAGGLIEANRDLWREGILTRREMRDLNRQIRDANERQKRQLVADATGSLLLDLYQLLGDEEAAARLRYELTVLELQLRREELVLAYQRLGLEFEALGMIDDLIAQVIAAGPGLFLNGGGSAGGDRLEQQQRERDERARSVGEVFAQAVIDFRSAVADLARSTQELLTNEELSPLTPQQKLNAAKADYQATLAAARGGDLDALRRFDEVRRTLLSIAQGFYAGGVDELGRNPAYQALFQQILRDTATLATPEVEQAVTTKALLDLVASQQAGQVEQHEDLTAIHDKLVDIADSLGGKILPASRRFAGPDRPQAPTGASGTAQHTRADYLLEQVLLELKGLRDERKIDAAIQTGELRTARLQQTVQK